MLLPGGLVSDEGVRRDFRFKPVNGSLELMLRETAMLELTHPQKVTAILVQALAELGEGPVDAERVSRLCVGDRQFLLRQLGIHIDDSPLWLSTHCARCNELFEISIMQSELPVKDCGSGYPAVPLELSIGTVKVSAPDGRLQERLAKAADAQGALHELLSGTVTTIGAEPIDIESLTPRDVELIEEMMERISPEIATLVATDCPYCGAANHIRLSPYYCMQQSSADLYTEVHNLAMMYHWSEESILAMPRSRRKAYLQLVDRSRGMQAGPNDHGRAI